MVSGSERERKTGLENNMKRRQIGFRNSFAKGEIGCVLMMEGEGQV